jgi:hypothetical protein
MYSAYLLYFKQRLRLNFKVTLLLETFNKNKKLKKIFKIFNFDRYLNYSIHVIKITYISRIHNIPSNL